MLHVIVFAQFVGFCWAVLMVLKYLLLGVCFLVLLALVKVGP